MTTVNVSDRPAHDVKADALVLATVSADGSAALAEGHGLPREAATHLTAALTALGAKGSADEVLKVAAVPGVAAPLVVLTGLGEVKDSTTAQSLRRAAGAATRALNGVAKVAIALPASGAGLGRRRRRGRRPRLLPVCRCAQREGRRGPQGQGQGQERGPVRGHRRDRRRPRTRSSRPPPSAPASSPTPPPTPATSSTPRRTCSSRSRSPSRSRSARPPRRPRSR